MDILKTVAEMRREHQNGIGTVGLVPTMGYLHEGHIALVEQAKRENDCVVVSIFVNPTQFGPNEDFSRYPRDPERDTTMLRAAGATYLFMPSVEEIYPQGAQTFVEVTDVSQGLEGERRPGHFRGVATVVAKLFNIVQPQRAYFGQKDAQQVAVIGRMVRDLLFPVELVIVPILRASDGLALSSRNVYLNGEQRAAAPILYEALSAARGRYEQGIHSGPALREIMRNVLATAPGAVVDYVSAADAETLRELDGTTERPILLSMAVRIGTTRLIDNLVLKP
jgi:pantoate--beta-alanine ligase